MKYLIFILFAAFSSCAADEVSPEDTALFEHIKDSLSKKMLVDMNKTALDTVGSYLSPVKIVSAKITSGEYSNFRNVRLRYKNVSEKKVVGIKFGWYGENVFGEPADMGNPVLNGYGGGFTEDVLRPGSSDAATFEILSNNAKKLKYSWVREVVFDDGSKWLIGGNND